MNKFTLSLFEKLKSKNLSDSSIKLYIRNLEKINNNTPLLNLNFLNKIENVKSFIDKYSINTQRSFYISIVSCLGLFKQDSKALLKMFSIYYEKMLEINKQIKSIDTNVKSETQNDNWVDFSVLEEKQKELKKIVESYGDKLNKEQYDTLLNYVILSLYVLESPRRNKDFQLMKIVKNYNDKLDKEFNYLDLTKKEFIFNNYKTSKKLGQVLMPINDALFEVLETYFKYHPFFKKLNSKNSIYLLVNYDGGELGNINDITKRLNKVMDKKISSSMIRHIYLSQKYGATLAEMKNDSYQMSHNLQTQKDYIKGSGPITVSFDI